MTDHDPGLSAPSEPSRRLAPASRLVRALYTHNPFYVLSADLIFIGLRMSFDPTARDFDTWALLSGLVGYILLLATTAALLVRYGRVWDDMRSVLLLVVMMFLALSSTIDDVLIRRPGVGLGLAVGGLAFSVLVSEGLLRWMRLGMPALYRGPYYLILALFFLYPVGLRPLLASPYSPLSYWALFGFSTAAGLAFLTLVPAIRRGGAYVKGNGSPWRWPLYPWSLFFFLGLGVGGRAYYLCISLHNVEGYRSSFGPYFLVPFGFAVAWLMLEGGIASGKQGLRELALMMPVGLVALAMAGHRPDAVYGHFLAMFREGLGVSPPAATLLVATAFYAAAAWRSVDLARGFAMATLVALSVVGPGTLGLSSLEWPSAWPLLPVAAVQGWLAIRRRESWRALVAMACAVPAASSLADPSWSLGGAGVVAFHLAIVGCLALGAAFDDEVGRQLRGWGLTLLLVGALGVVAGVPPVDPSWPPSWRSAYPLTLALVAAGYGYLAGGWPFLAGSGTILAAVLAVSGWGGYATLRRQVAGLDRIAGGLASFALAALISLGKAGMLRRWLDGARPWLASRARRGRRRALDG